MINLSYSKKLIKSRRGFNKPLECIFMSLSGYALASYNRYHGTDNSYLHNIMCDVCAYFRVVSLNKYRYTNKQRKSIQDILPSLDDRIPETHSSELLMLVALETLYEYQHIETKVFSNLRYKVNCILEILSEEEYYKEMINYYREMFLGFIGKFNKNNTTIKKRLSTNVELLKKETTRKEKFVLRLYKYCITTLKEQDDVIYLKIKQTNESFLNGLELLEDPETCKNLTKGIFNTTDDIKKIIYILDGELASHGKLSMELVKQYQSVPNLKVYLDYITEDEINNITNYIRETV